MKPVVGTPSLQRFRSSLKSGGAIRLLSKLMVLVTVASVMCGRALASPVTWAEVGDAGQLPATAQVPTGIGTLDAITGTIGFHDVDLYEIFLTGSRTFSATASAPTSPDSINPMLFLFDAAGHGVYANDDMFPPDPFFFGAAQLPSGSALTPPVPGVYFLAISGIDFEPASAAGAIFPCVHCVPGVVVGPTGPGGGEPVTDWSGFQFSGGAYTITLTGAQFVPSSAPVPEPATGLLIGWGLLALRTLRKKARHSNQ